MILNSFAPSRSSRALFSLILLTRCLTIPLLGFMVGLLFNIKFYDIIVVFSCRFRSDYFETRYLSMVKFSDLQLCDPDQNYVNDHHNEDIDENSQPVIWSFYDAADAQKCHNTTHP